jgi:hypothetical protein
MNNNAKNRMKLVQAWQDGLYLEVAEEVANMHIVDLLEFLSLFIKDNGLKEVEVLKRFIE